MNSITERQRAILDYIESHRKFGIPTVREVAKHFGLSPATTQAHITALKGKASC